MQGNTLRSLTALAFSVAALAQSSDTTGAFRGRIMTAKSAPLAAATVTVRSLETGFTRSAQSTADGGFVLGLLPVGDYKVTVKAAGMKPLEDKVRISLGDAASRAYRMEEETATAVIEIVAASQTLDGSQVNGLATVDEKLVQSIPLVNRNFLDLVRLTPGAVAGPGNPPRLMVQGARQIMNNLQIDGATNNSNFFGEQRGGAIIPFVFGADTIRELQVITNGYDAQYGNAAGATINAITKGGTNDFSGSALYLVRNDRWMAKAKPTPFEANLGQNSDKNLTRVGDSYNLNFNVGGPIVKDRLFYFVGYETYSTSRLATPAFGTPTAASEISAFSALQATGLWSVITSANGHTLGQEGTTQFPYMQETHNTSYFGRLDYNLAEGQRLTLRINYNKFKDTIGGGNSVNTPESNELLNTTNAISWVLEHSAVWTPEIVSETRLQVSNERRPFAGNGASPAIAVTSAFTAGTKTSTPRQMNEIMTELINNTTWSRGDWALKAGFDLQKIAIDNQFFNNGNGSISFSTYAMANAWARNDFTTGTPTGTITYNGATSFNGGRVHIDTNLNGEYLQGQYQGFLDKHLTLTAGLRFNQQTVSKNPIANANLGGLDSAVDSTTTDPRFAFAYDFGGKGKTVLRGGYGWFSTPTPMLLVANTMTGNGNTITNYAFTYAGNAAAFQGTGPLSYASLVSGQTFSKASDTALQTLAAGTGGSTAVQVWDPETKMSRAKKTSLGIEHDLGDGLTVSATATYTEFSHLQYLENINLNQGSLAGPLDANGFGPSIAYNDGYADPNLNAFSRGNGTTVFRPGYAVVRGHFLDFRKGSLAGGNPVGGFGDVFLVKGDGIGRYRGLSLEVKKTWSPEAGLIANITFSNAQDTNSNERGTFTSSFGVNSELALAATTNPANPRADWGNAASDRFCVMNLMAYFPLAFGIKGSTRFNYATGLPYSALSASDNTFKDSNGNVLGGGGNGDGVVNDIAFGGRNGQRQPDTKVVDLRLTRAFKIYRQYEIETSLDVFNLFNWANQFVDNNQQVATQVSTVGTAPNTTQTITPNPNYAKLSGRDFSTREVQLGIRVKF